MPDYFETIKEFDYRCRSERSRTMADATFLRTIKEFRGIKICFDRMAPRILNPTSPLVYFKFQLHCDGCSFFFACCIKSSTPRVILVAIFTSDLENPHIG